MIGVEHSNMGQGMTIPSSLLEGLISEIDQITSTAWRINGLASETRSRVFGPWPTAAENAIGKASSPSSLEERSRHALAVLREALAGAEENVAALANRL